MKAPVLVAPNAFKGTLNAVEAALAVSRGLARAGLEARPHPLTDGGDGFAETLRFLLGGRTERFSVRGPLGGRLECGALFLDGECFIETACACGLRLMDEPSPLRADTRGVGELLAAAAALRPAAIYAGLGGSGTVDMGLGAAAAFGARFLDREGRETVPAPENFPLIERATPPPAPFPPEGTELHVLYDTSVTLLEGLRVYSPQKGLDGPALERHLAECARLAEAFDRAAGRRVSEMPGSGAAGGLCAGLAWFAGGRAEDGFAWFARRTGLAEALDSCRAVVTGEGGLYDLSYRQRIALGPGRVGDAAQSYNGNLGRVDDAVDAFYAEIAQVGNADGLLRHFRAPQFAGAGSGDEIVQCAHGLIQIHLLCIKQSGGNQTTLAQ